MIFHADSWEKHGGRKRLDKPITHISKKQARNPRQTERASRHEIPIILAESLCSRVATKEDAEVRLGQETALGVSIYALFAALTMLTTSCALST